MTLKLRIIAVAAMLPASALMADFSYTQTTSITGGQLAAMANLAGRFTGKANQPTTMTHYVKGDKMAAIGSTNGSIVDLGAETITQIDFQKKTYTVMTFAEMKQMMEQMTGKAGQMPDAKFKISANPTGITKQIAGVNAKEIVITMEMEMTDAKSGKSGSMKITTDSWVSSDVAGYDQVRDFYKKMAGKISWMPGAGSAMMGRPDMAKGMEEVAKEMAKMDGVPVLQVMKMGGAPGGADIPQMTPEQQSQLDEAMAKANEQQQASPSASSAIASALGLPKFGGFGKKKPAADAPATAAAPAARPNKPAEPGVLMETTIESTGFSTAGVDSSKFEIPAGFKKVDSPRMSK